MKKLKMLAALLLISAGSYAQKLPADSIFSQFYKATGGKALWDGVKSYNLKRSYTASAATPYDATITASIPEQSIHKNKTIMKRSFAYTVKGDQGWIKVPIGQRTDVKDMSQAEQQTMRQELYDNLVPFINYKDRGLIATTVGTETLNGAQVNNVELQGRGVKYNLYFDAKSGLLVRQKESKAGVEKTSDLSDYAKSAYGIMYPTKVVELSSSDRKPVTIKSILTVNDAVNVELFKR